MNSYSLFRATCAFGVDYLELEGFVRLQVDFLVRVQFAQGLLDIVAHSLATLLDGPSGLGLQLLLHRESRLGELVAYGGTVWSQVLGRLGHQVDSFLL